MLYIDHAKNVYGRMRMSHLMADSFQELDEARKALGIPESGIHNQGQPSEHLDVSETKRTEAINRLGAKEVSSKELVLIVRERRKPKAGEATVPTNQPSGNSDFQESELPDP